MKKKIALLHVLLGLFLAPCLMRAQDQLPIGNWRTHLPFNSMVGVTQSADRVYFGAQQMVVAVDKADGAITRIDRVAGLSDVEIQRIKYHEELDLLLVAYKNGNIDLVTPQGIVNIADLLRFTLITDKTVHHIHFSGNYAYLSCSFGLLALDLLRYEVAATYRTDDIAVRAACVLHDTIYIATDDGIYQGNPTVNLLDFDNWQRHETAQGLPMVYQSNVMEWFGDRLFADINDTLKYFDGQMWQHFPLYDLNGNTVPQFHLPNHTFRSLEPSLNSDLLMVTTSFDVMFVAPDGYHFRFYAPDYITNPQQAVRDGELIWYADRFMGAGRIENFAFFPLRINAPLTDKVFQMNITNNTLRVATGGITDRWGILYRTDGIFTFQEGTWSYLNRTTHPDLQNVFDYLDVVPHPSNGKLYIGTYNKGLIEIDGEQVTIYDATNSTLQSPAGDPSSVRVGSLFFDPDGNLWMSNFLATYPISVLKKDGTWQRFLLPQTATQLGDGLIDQHGFKWFANEGGDGLVVFDDRNTLNDPTDDRYRILTTDNSLLPSDKVNCLALDQDGSLWVGTDAGTVVFDCTARVFDLEGCEGSLVVVEQDDFGGYLLETENVTSIAIDGANRKWFGTENGVFVQLPDSLTTLHYFNTTNSPLLSNRVIDIAINPTDGEVFIGTEQGIVSYRSDATEGSSLHAETAHIFPNPVRPDYNGLIAIRGLAEEADVKITDLSGKLVYQTTSLGGQAVWNGSDYNGRRVASGVYLVFSARRDGLDNLVAKLLFLH